MLSHMIETTLQLTVEKQTTAIIEKQFVRTEGTVEEERQWYYYKCQSLSLLLSVLSSHTANRSILTIPRQWECPSFVLGHCICTTESLF